MMQGSVNTAQCAKGRISLLFSAQVAVSTFAGIIDMYFVISNKRLRNLDMQVQISYNVHFFMRDQYARKKGWLGVGSAISNIAWLIGLRISIHVKG